MTLTEVVLLRSAWSPSDVLKLQCFGEPRILRRNQALAGDQPKSGRDENADHTDQRWNIGHAESRAATGLRHDEPEKVGVMEHEHPARPEGEETDPPLRV